MAKPRIFACPRCPEKFMGKGALHTHLASAHGKAATREQRQFKEDADARRKQLERMHRIDNEVMLGQDVDKTRTVTGTSVVKSDPCCKFWDGMRLTRLTPCVV